MPFSREKQRRICKALQENIDIWYDALVEIESYAIPGNKHRILSLMKSLAQAKQSIGRIMSDDLNHPCS